MQPCAPTHRKMCNRCQCGGLAIHHAKNLHPSPLRTSGTLLVVVRLPTRDYCNIASDPILTMQRAREPTLLLPTGRRRNSRRIRGTSLAEPDRYSTGATGLVLP